MAEPAGPPPAEKEVIGFVVQIIAAKLGEHLLAEQGEPVFAAFTLYHFNAHGSTVDVTDPEVAELSQAHAGAVNERKKGTVPEVSRCLEQLFDFCLAHARRQHRSFPGIDNGRQYEGCDNTRLKRKERLWAIRWLLEWPEWSTSLQ